MTHPINDADPRDLLNQIKRFQPHLSGGFEYNPYSFGQSQTLPNMRPMSQDNIYGLPLQYPGSQVQQYRQPDERYMYGDNDLLRKSFAR